ncbi:MAG TPA: hypothetical protein VMB75_03910, partial [Rhodocyclaceae bacterium]|nr:hypothetical protein [Rhodocyclaceae bacterium]
MMAVEQIVGLSALTTGLLAAILVLALSRRRIRRQLQSQLQACEDRLNQLGSRLLDSESRNALIPGLEKEAGDLRSRLLE